jgi:membrane-bound serine protease (ClpP class)
MVSGGFIVLVLYFVVRTQKKDYVSGLEGMIGERGQAVTALSPRGRVYLHGEYWDARAEEEVAKGCEVEVVKSEPNLKLLVRAIEPDQATSAKEPDNVSD